MSPMMIENSKTIGTYCTWDDHNTKQAEIFLDQLLQDPIVKSLRVEDGSKNSYSDLLSQLYIAGTGFIENAHDSLVKRAEQGNFPLKMEVRYT